MQYGHFRNYDQGETGAFQEILWQQYGIQLFNSTSNDAHGNGSGYDGMAAGYLL